MNETSFSFPSVDKATCFRKEISHSHVNAFPAFAYDHKTVVLVGKLNSTELETAKTLANSCS